MTDKQPVPEGLREYVAAHNRHAAWLSGGALLLSLLLWTGLWLAVQWGGLLVLTVVHGVQTPAQPRFLPAYLLLAALLLLLRWLVMDVLIWLRFGQETKGLRCGFFPRSKV